jgi:ribosome-associated protein
MAKRRVSKVNDNTEEILQAVVHGMLEKKAHQITVLDLRNISSALADYFVICHGTSTTQVEAIARSVEEVSLKEAGENPVHLEGVGNAQWILVDYFTVVAHIFEEKAREYYDLEELWADAAVLAIEERA